MHVPKNLTAQFVKILRRNTQGGMETCAVLGVRKQIYFLPPSEVRSNKIQVDEKSLLSDQNADLVLATSQNKI
jgi:hypothetical protein